MFPSRGEEMNRERTTVPETNCSGGCGVERLQFAIGVHRCVNRGGFSKTLPTAFQLGLCKWKPRNWEQAADLPLSSPKFYPEKCLSNISNKNPQLRL